MKKMILVLALSPLFAFAADKAAPAHAHGHGHSGSMEDHVKMHETMAKAHTDAAACLKGGKSAEECGKEFHKSCGAGHADGMCPMMAGKGHKGKHGKKQ